MVPYFRKAAVLAEIGWQEIEEEQEEGARNVPSFDNNNFDRQRPSITEQNCQTSMQDYTRAQSVSPGGTEGSSSSGDCKTIPLYGTFVRRLFLSKLTSTSSSLMQQQQQHRRNHSIASSAREDEDEEVMASFGDNLKHQEQEEVVIVIQSASLSRAAILRFDSEAKGSSWFAALHRTVGQITVGPTIRRISELQKKGGAADVFDGCEVLTMGWFLEKKVPGSRSSRSASALLSLFKAVFIFCLFDLVNLISNFLLYLIGK